ncbi:MAG: hypothetical protein OCC49_20165, partial [Fibrobacterales bacterium]
MNLFYTEAMPGPQGDILISSNSRNIHQWSEIGCIKMTIIIVVFLGFLSSLSAAAVNVTTVNQTMGEGGVTAALSFTMDATDGADVTVNFNVIGGTATGGGADFTLPATSTVITNGTLVGTATVTLIDDLLDENNETVIVQITSVTGGAGSVGPSDTHTITINDNDDPPTVSLAYANATINENAASTNLVATLGALSELDVVVGITYGGDATATADYTSGNTITVSAGSISSSIAITGVDDALDEPDELVIASISSLTNATELGGGGTQIDTVSIVDDEGVPAVTLSIDNAAISENGGVATVTATLDVASGQNIVVKLSIAGTATVTDDYTIGADSIIIYAGQFTGTVLISAVSEGVYEPDETIIVDLLSVVDGAATETGTQQVTTTLNDANTLPTVTLLMSADTVTEGGAVTLTAILSAPSSIAVVVDYTFGGTAVSGVGNDYT